MTSRELLRTALGQACSALPAETRNVPLEHWNESTFRFLLVRQLLDLDPNAICWSEWNRVDLVLPAPSGATLVELKFLAHQPLRNVSGRIVRFKGGPSLKNVREVEHTLKTLAASPKKRWALSCGGVAAGYVVLAYCDPGAAGKQRRYSNHYSNIGANERIVDVETIVEGLPIADGALFTCKLLSVRLERPA